MIFELIIGIASFALNTTLGLLVYLRNPKSATNKLFVILTLLINIYLVVNFLSLHPPRGQGESQLFWIRVVMSVVSLIGPALLLLVITFPHTKMHLRKRAILGVIGLGVTSFFVSLSPFLFTSIEYPDGEPLPIPGLGMPIFFASFIGLSLVASILLIIKYRRAVGIEKSQFTYFLIGIVLTFSAMAFTTVLLTVLFKFTGLVFLGPNTIIILVAFVAYAIVKHRFLDIRLILARVLSYTLLTFFIAFGYMALLFNLAFFLGGVAPTLSTLLGFVQPTFLALIFVFSFQPLRHLFETLTSNIFYKNRYDLQDVLWKLSRTMASTLALRDLSHGILQELLSSIKISYGSIVLVRNQAVIWVDSAGSIHNKTFKSKDIFTIIHESYKPKSRDEQIIIFEELSERKKDIKNIMREHDITIVLPLVVRKQLIGGLILGEKHSGEIYSSDDIDLLKIVAPEVAIAVRNALSFEEIKHFNITLEEEVRRATARLKKANERLKELDLLKDEFVSIASHELRTPMTAIKSYLWMALNQSDQKINQPLKKYLDISYNSTERLIRLVNDMLTVSRIERNKIEIDKKSLDINEIVQLVFDELKIVADEKHITFTFAKEEKKKYMTKGDKEKLREVFQNLIGNALKFTPEKGAITIRMANKGKMLACSITDTGSGIPKEEQRKLFKKFSKIEYSYSKHSSQPGTGLGLYISKQIISLHNGTIEVQSEVDKGSTFTVLLPELIP